MADPSDWPGERTHNPNRPITSPVGWNDWESDCLCRSEISGDAKQSCLELLETVFAAKELV